MALALIKSFDFSEDRKKTLQILEERYPEVQSIRDECFRNAQIVLDRLAKEFNKHNASKEDFLKEENMIIKVTHLIYVFYLMEHCINKQGEKYKQVASMYNNIKKERDHIVTKTNESLLEMENNYKDQLRERKITKETMDNMSESIKKLKIANIKSDIECPVTYGSQKENSIKEFVDTMDLALDEIRFDDDGNIIVTGEQINNEKKTKKLNGHKAPRNIKDTDVIVLKT